jgi:hypothetical protein
MFWPLGHDKAISVYLGVLFTCRNGNSPSPPNTHTHPTGTHMGLGVLGGASIATRHHNNILTSVTSIVAVWRPASPLTASLKYVLPLTASLGFKYSFPPIGTCYENIRVSFRTCNPPTPKGSQACRIVIIMFSSLNQDKIKSLHPSIFCCVLTTEEIALALPILTPAPLAHSGVGFLGGGAIATRPPRDHDAILNHYHQQILRH